MSAESTLRQAGTWGIVLAGAYLKGRSLFERLRPRPLLPVAQQPIVSYTLRWLADAGVEGVTVCLNGESRGVRRAVEQQTALRCPVRFHEDSPPRGTAGIARDAALATGMGTFFVVDATAMPAIEPREILDVHRTSAAAVTVLVRRRAVSTPRAALSPAGVYVFDRRTFEHVPGHGFQDIKETLLSRLHAAGETIATHETDVPGNRVLDTETYLAANERLIPRAVAGDAPEGFLRLGSALVHATAHVAAGARLVGPVIVGPETRIADGATVVGPTAIGAGCELGPTAVVSRSVLWDNCALGEGALVDRCLLSDGGFVPAGSQLYGALKAGLARSRAREVERPAALPHGGSAVAARAGAGSA